MKRPCIRLMALLAIITSLVVLPGCDDGGSSSSGGDALKALVDANEGTGTTQSSESEEGTQETQSLNLTSSDDGGEQATTASASAQTLAAEAAATSNQRARGDFDLTLTQTYQPCPDCGVWFDSIELVIVHSHGTFTKSQGRMHVKKAPNRVGHFVVDISSIPAEAQIINAKLNMLLNRDDGIANSDFTTVLAVHGKINGQSTFVREITAKDDIKGKGYSKANPMVPVDFTSYAKQL